MGLPVTLTMAMAAGFAVIGADPAAAMSDACTSSGPAHRYHAISGRDGGSILTKEGPVIVLAGIVAAGELDGDPQASARAAEMLDRLVSGRTISVQGDVRDRYGRFSGQVFVMQDTGSVWIQAAMVAAGEVRVAPQMDVSGCTAVLLQMESEARASGHGVWSDSRFAVRGSSDLQQLTEAEGRFMVVEGVVRRIGESAGRIYLDFGRRFNEDFSVIIPPDAHKAFTSAGIDLRSLEGTRVRVRDIVSLRGGPAIELRDPAALESLRAGGA